MNATAALPIVGEDLAKSAFQLAVADGSWRVVDSHRFTRTQFERWFANRAVGLGVMEASGSREPLSQVTNGPKNPGRSPHPRALRRDRSPIMATRVVPTPLDADNSAGSFTLAACNDWRTGVRRFHVGTGHDEPTYDAGYTSAGSLGLPPHPIKLLPFGWSPYTWLGPQPQESSVVGWPIETIAPVVHESQRARQPARPSDLPDGSGQRRG